VVAQVRPPNLGAPVYRRQAQRGSPTFLYNPKSKKGGASPKIKDKYFPLYKTTNPPKSPFDKGGLRGIIYYLFCCSNRRKGWMTKIIFCRNHLQISKNGYGIVRAFHCPSRWDSIDRLMVFFSNQPQSCWSL